MVYVILLWVEWGRDQFEGVATGLALNKGVGGCSGFGAEHWDERRVGKESI